MEYNMGDYLYNIFVTICKRQEIELGRITAERLLKYVNWNNIFISKIKEQEFIFEKQQLDLVTAVFNIYDNDSYLNQEYGGSGNNYIKVLHFLERELESKSLPIDFTYTQFDKNIFKDFIIEKCIYDIYELKKFF